MSSGVFERSRGLRFLDIMFGGFKLPYGTPLKVVPVENKMLCSLEDLYNGSTRKMKFSNNIAGVRKYFKFFVPRFCFKSMISR